jgi:superfamily II DNA or RNA helicase
MSEPIVSSWWGVREPEGQPGFLSRLFAGQDASDAPATLLRLPAVLQVGRATSRQVKADIPLARQHDVRGAGYTIDMVRGQVGYVKMWRAKSVDLSRSLFASAAVPYSYPLQEGDEAGLAGRPRPGGVREDRPEMPLDPVAARLAALTRRLVATLQPPPESLLQAHGPLEWPGAFYPYQQVGVQALLQSSHLLLADEMGLGKTVQVIAALRLLLRRREIERSLIVVPASLLAQWRQELARWAPELRVITVHGSPEDRLWQWQYRAHVTLTSYETLRADTTGSDACGPCREEWGVVVLDEAHRIKNRHTDVARICKRLPRRRSWAMTGTPMENRPEDVISLLDFVTGNTLARSNLLASGVALRGVLSQYQLRRRKADVLRELPPKIVTELTLPLTPTQRRAYDRAEKEELVVLRQQDVRIENVLAMITRLKQICNFAPDDGASAKINDLAGRLEELAAEGHKALVFTQYTDDQVGAQRIAQALSEFAPLVYTADYSPQERERILTRFRQDDRHKVLILSIKAGGHGLNLQVASYVFFFDRWWNPAVEQQAEDRAHRLGQTEPVHIYKYLMEDTIEQRIDAVLRGKVREFDHLMDGATIDTSSLLDRQDLYGLVGVEPRRGERPEPTEAQQEERGLPLERRVAELLRHQGYEVEETPRTRDGGLDLIATKTDSVGARTRLFVQCKETVRPVGVEVVRSLNGVLPQGGQGGTGVLVCPAGFTVEAQTFAHARNIQLWDAARLKAMEV